MPSVTVVTFSDSFGGLWANLGNDLGVAIQVVPAQSAGAPGPDATALILSAGGAEREALQWLDVTTRPAGLVTLMVGADPGRRMAMQAVTRGASDYYALPDDLELLRSAIVAATRGRRALPADADAPAGADVAAFAAIVGESRALKRELARAARVLPHRNARVLILGETGTGKEVLARAIHAGGPRRDAPFVAVNCSALPENLIESELFGHERGSFTDAHAAKPGLFEMADGGTLFLDEIGELPLALQAKLLRVLEDGEIRRVGGTKSRIVDVRLLAATNEDLPRRMQQGTFREDLYFRLSTVTLTLPPLRDREDDVVLIAQAVLSRLAVEHDVPPPTLSADLRRLLRSHPWPGNIRELKNSLERALLLSPPGELLAEELVTAAPAPDRAGTAPFPFPASLREIMAAVAQATVEAHDGNRSEAARQLGISTKRLRRLLSGELGDEGPEDADSLVAPPERRSLAS